jgi:hypothetical protein
MSHYHLAQVNIARLVAPLDSPELAGFVARLADVNALADRASGFVWRLQTEEGDATALRPYEDDRILVNLSVWTGLEALHQFVFRSDHAEVMRQRRAWFQRMVEAYVALWWIPTGRRPSVQEAKERLEHLRTHGETPTAFSFHRPFPPPDTPPAGPLAPLADECPATS